MKHVFVVHSHITYLAALGVAAQKGLASEDILFVSQHYRREAPVPVVPIHLFSCNVLRPREFFDFARRTDRLIERFTGGEPFRAYVPALTKPAKVVATHSLCAGFDFIEEGLGSYLRQYAPDVHTYEQRNTPMRASLSGRYIKSLIYTTANVLRGETARFTALPVHYTSYANDPKVGFYGFHPAVFPLADTPTLLDFRQTTERFDFSAEPTLPDGAVVLIGEGLFSLVSGYSVAQYVELLQGTVVPWLQRRDTRQIYLKHHYNESDESRRASRAVFQEAGIEVRAIDDSVVLEAVLLRSKDIALVGYSSSLLFYGALMGCNAYSYRADDGLPIEAFRKLVCRITEETP